MHFKEKFIYFSLSVNHWICNKTQNTDQGVLTLYHLLFVSATDIVFLLLFLENIFFFFCLRYFHVLFPLLRKPVPDFSFHRWLLHIREFFLFVQEKVSPLSSDIDSMMTWLNLFDGKLPDLNPNSKNLATGNS